MRTDQTRRLIEKLAEEPDCVEKDPGSSATESNGYGFRPGENEEAECP